MKSIQASDILYFAHSTGVKGKIQRVGCWRGNPYQECVGKADEQACPPFQCTLVFRACCPCFLISFCLCCPFDTEVHLALNTLCFHFLSCPCLSVDVFHFTFFCFCRGISSSSSNLMADGFVVGAVLFCHLILWGRASENAMAADWREDSEANTCLKVFGQTLPLGSLLWLPLLKGHPSMTAVGYEV